MIVNCFSVDMVVSHDHSALAQSGIEAGLHSYADKLMA